MDNIKPPTQTNSTSPKVDTVPPTQTTRDLQGILEDHLPTAASVQMYSSAAIKFSKFQQVLTPVAMVLQASNAVTYFEQALACLGSILGIVAAIVKVKQKNRLIEGLESLKKGRFNSQKEKQDFVTLIKKPDILAQCLSKEFVKKYNIHIDQFFGMKNGKEVVQLDISLHKKLDEIITQIKTKRMMDVINGLISTLSLAVFIGSMVVMPPLVISYLPIIFLVLAYVMEKRIDNLGASLSLEMFIPDFIKDIQSQTKILDILKITDLHRHFTSNKALFATHLKADEIKELDKKIKKIKKAKPENIDKLRNDFSLSLKRMLKKKTTQDKIEAIGLGLIAGGGISMLAPIGPFALIAILPVILAGLVLKLRPNSSSRVLSTQGNRILIESL